MLESVSGKYGGVGLIISGSKGETVSAVCSFLTEIFRYNCIGLTL